MLVACFPRRLVPGGNRPQKVANLLHAETLRWVLNFFNAFRFAVDNATPITSSCSPQAILDADIFTFLPGSIDPEKIASGQAAPLLDQARVFRGEEIKKLELGFGDIGERFFMRMPLSLEVLRGACDLLNRLASEFDRNIELLALLNEAVYLIRQADFHRSLITSWSACEFLINREWESYLDSTNEVILSEQQRAKTLNSDRRKSLVDGPEWTAASKLEVLELAKRIPFSLYRDLRDVRKARNQWLHKLDYTDSRMANLAFRVGRDLMSRRLGVELPHRGTSYLDAAAFENITGKPGNGQPK